MQYCSKSFLAGNCPIPSEQFGIVSCLNLEVLHRMQLQIISASKHFRNQLIQFLFVYLGVLTVCACGLYTLVLRVY